ncbi:MAG: hypothetical protein MZV65_22555, partial [Chromatiales bacterium]|nr:hypothetical protein [Chromatiales bacterium]
MRPDSGAFEAADSRVGQVQCGHESVTSQVVELGNKVGNGNFTIWGVTHHALTYPNIRENCERESSYSGRARLDQISGVTARNGPAAEWG